MEGIGWFFVILLCILLLLGCLISHSLTFEMRTVIAFLNIKMQLILIEIINGNC